mmetsp:Transcript_1308/g.4446  ORF Transcript_1308/g.4446 Transcript_1308/m.4446 type:complete len:225 (+) Transcript_1308:547-1221(+)
MPRIGQGPLLPRPVPDEELRRQDPPRSPLLVERPRRRGHLRRRGKATGGVLLRRHPRKVGGDGVRLSLRPEVERVPPGAREAPVAEPPEVPIRRVPPGERRLRRPLGRPTLQTRPQALQQALRRPEAALPRQGQGPPRPRRSGHPRSPAPRGTSHRGPMPKHRRRRSPSHRQRPRLRQETEEAADLPPPASSEATSGPPHAPLVRPFDGVLEVRAGPGPPGVRM